MSSRADKRDSKRKPIKAKQNTSCLQIPCICSWRCFTNETIASVWSVPLFRIPLQGRGLNVCHSSRALQISCGSSARRKPQMSWIKIEFHVDRWSVMKLEIRRWNRRRLVMVALNPGFATDASTTVYILTIKAMQKMPFLLLLFSMPNLVFFCKDLDSILLLSNIYPKVNFNYFLSISMLHGSM